MSSSLSSSTLSLVSSAIASPVMRTQSAEKFAWETALYLVVTAAVVAIIAGTIVFVGRADWTISPCKRVKMASKGPDSAPYHLPSAASILVRGMFHYFFTTLWPTFRHLRQATTSSLRSAVRQPQPVLPLFRTPGFREQPLLTAPRPAVPRDSSSFRVPSNPLSGPSGLPSSPSPSLPSFPSSTP
ncbi:hypothetical protein BJV78DRAFT_153072 [Lactifluus subvellereus]|nr:hypothetical protein BJV78DRAFT_153072 [Lactifluus subvellereus]